MGPTLSSTLYLAHIRPLASLVWLLRRLLHPKLPPPSKLCIVRPIPFLCLGAQQLTALSLSQPLYSDPARSEFFWVPPTDEDDSSSSSQPNLDSVPEDERFYIIAGELIRLRVTSESFSDVTPKVAPKAQHALPAAGGAATGGPGQPGNNASDSAVNAGPAPYKIEGSIQEAGLGLLDWWKGGEEEVEELAEAVEAHN